MSVCVGVLAWLPRKSARTIARRIAMSLKKKASSEKLMRGKRESREKENKMKVLDSRRKAGGELSPFETEPF